MKTGSKKPFSVIDGMGRLYDKIASQVKSVLSPQSVGRVKHQTHRLRVKDIMSFVVRAEPEWVKRLTRQELLSHISEKKKNDDQK